MLKQSGYYTALGFTVSDSTIKYALITKSKNKTIVVKTQSIDIECKTALQSFFELTKKHPSTQAFPSEGGLSGAIKLKFKNKKDNASFLKNKLESSLIDQEIDLKTWPSSKDKVSYYSKPKESIDLLFKSSESISPDLLLPSCLCYTNLLQQLKDRDMRIWIFCGTFGVEVLCVKQNILVEGKFFPKNHPRLIKDLERKVAALKARHPDLQTELHVIGNDEFCSSFIDNLGQSDLNVLKKEISSIENLYPEYLLEVGAALSFIKGPDHTFGSPKKALNFLRKLYAPHLKLCFFLFLFCSVLNIAIWKKKLLSYADHNNKLYQKLAATPFLNPPEAKKNLPLQHEPFSTALLRNKTLNCYKKSPPFFWTPTTFTVSQTLAKLKELFDEFDERAPPFFIDSFEYRLVSNPTVKNPKAPYLVKVTLQINPSSPEMARKVYDKLSCAKEFIQLDKKISWSFQNNRYQASFYLKNFPSPSFLEYYE